MSATTPAVLKLYQRIVRWPFGHWAFSRAVCWRAPYFASIRPRFVDLRRGRCEATMAKRRSVKNHIGTVHAIAMVNLCELVAGTLSEATVPADKRWIPKGMTVKYLRKAETDLTAVGVIDENTEWRHGTDLPITVNVLDETSQAVVRAVITMWITDKRAR